jgi:hypothetical protein
MFLHLLLSFVLPNLVLARLGAPIQNQLSVCLSFARRERYLSGLSRGKAGKAKTECIPIKKGKKDYRIAIR